MSFALPSSQGEVVFTGLTDLEPLLEASRQSPRLRMIQPIQRNESAPVQRLLNAMQPGTYVHPHRHNGEGASESVVVLQGELGFVVFDEEGAVEHSYFLSAGSMLDIEPGVWHSMVCLAPDTVIAEFKKGPYDAKLDKCFASWAREDDPSLLKRMEELFKDSVNRFKQ